MPGSPTALTAPEPPPLLPLNRDGASTVRRLGVATSPPGHSGVPGGWPPVAAA